MNVRHPRQQHDSDSATTRSRPAAAARRASGLLGLALLITLAFASGAQAQAPVPLGTADNFAVLGATTVTNTGPTVVNGDLGISPGTACTGLPSPCTGGGPGTVNGTIHSADSTSAQAQSDLTAAYINAAGQPASATIPTQLGGTTQTPGVYDSAAGDFNITGTLTLDAQGNPDAIFIFKTASTLVTAAENSQVDLINGAQSCNVFWQVGSSATLGTNTLFRGNILALTAITATTGATVDGRLLARNAAVTMDNNTVTRAQCATPPPPPPPPPPPTTPPTVSVTGVPNQCTAHNFRVHIKVEDRSGTGIKHTDVLVDGKRIKRSTKKKFSAKVRAKGLSSGRHKLKVVATDNAGNVKKKSRKFRRCGRGVAVPPFTG